MRRSDAIAVLTAHRSELQRLGIDNLYHFGSTVRDEARAISDVDLFFDHPRGKLPLAFLIARFAIPPHHAKRRGR